MELNKEEVNLYLFNSFDFRILLGYLLSKFEEVFGISQKSWPQNLAESILLQINLIIKNANNTFSTFFSNTLIFSYFWSSFGNNFWQALMACFHSKTRLYYKSSTSKFVNNLFAISQTLGHFKLKFEIVFGTIFGLHLRVWPLRPNFIPTKILPPSPKKIIFFPIRIFRSFIILLSHFY